MTLPTGSNFRVDGKVALVTGAGQGLGLEMAKALAHAGARVYINDITEAAAACGVEALAALDLKAHPVPFDVTQAAQANQAIDGVEAEAGRIDILVNNAGILARKRLDEMDDADWDRVIDVDLSSVYRMSRRIGLSMADRGSGAIINLASIFGIRGRAGLLSYVAAKHGVVGLTHGLAAELGPRGVRVNAIAPGYVLTEINRSVINDPEFLHLVSARTPLKRWAEAHEIAGPVLFLASDAASFVHGHTLVVDGGISSTILQPAHVA